MSMSIEFHPPCIVRAYVLSFTKPLETIYTPFITKPILSMVLYLLLEREFLYDIIFCVVLKKKKKKKTQCW